ncbi:MAG: DUF6272 family protein [Bacteroidales bacterium]|jgi:hypothetical protein|nr:DUF6272 family protein [Bacteroidales bacterium]
MWEESKHIEKPNLKDAKNASFIHFGEKSALEAFDKWLEDTNYPNSIKKRIAFVFTEIAQNQSKHSADKQKNKIWIIDKDSMLEIFSINPIDEKHIQLIEDEFRQYLQRSTEEIKKENRQRIISGEKGTGLLQIKLKSETGPELHFIKQKNQINFILKTSIYVNNQNENG